MAWEFDMRYTLVVGQMECNCHKVSNKTTYEKLNSPKPGYADIKNLGSRLETNILL